MRIGIAIAETCFMKPAALLVLVLAGCAGSATSSTITTAAHVPLRNANDLLVGTASCWIGGMWGDVQGETPNEREASTVKRCDDVAQAGLGNRDRAIQLRAHETSAVTEMREAISKLANADAMDSRRKESMLRVYDCVEAAEHEIMHARRAAHRILRDEPRGIETLTATETSELPTLQAHQAYDDLARVDAGPLAVEAHVFLLWATLDRLRIAQQLPVHLKPYPIDAALRVVFSAPTLWLPFDASKPLERGAYLTYLVDAAQAARHPVLTMPVAASASDSAARYGEAMAGILEGISDQLRADALRLPESDLQRTTLLVVRALEQSRARAPSPT